MLRLVLSIIVLAVVLVPCRAADKPKKPKTEKGTVLAIDVTKNTITLMGKKKNEQGQLEPGATYKYTSEVKVTIGDQAGMFSDVQVGGKVLLKLSPDKESITAIDVRK